MATLILGALEGEVAAHRDRLSGRQEERWAHVRISSGQLGGSAVAVANTGVGKTMSALAAQHLLDAVGPERIVFVGMGGGLNPGLRIGDVIVATESLQYDLEAHEAGFDRGQVPFTPYGAVPSDPTLVSAALDFHAEDYRLVPGRVLTGDRFVSRSMDDGLLRLLEDLRGDAIDMEGASAGLVALINGLPYLLIRMISDRIGQEEKADFRRAVRVTSERTAAIVEHLLESLHG